MVFTCIGDGGARSLGKVCALPPRQCLFQGAVMSNARSVPVAQDCASEQHDPVTACQHVAAERRPGVAGEILRAADGGLVVVLRDGSAHAAGWGATVEQAMRVAQIALQARQAVRR